MNSKNKFLKFQSLFLSVYLLATFCCLTVPSEVIAKTSKSKTSSKKRTSKKRKTTKRRSTKRRRSSKRRRSTRSRKRRSSRSRRSRKSRRRRAKPKPKPLTAAQIQAKKKRLQTQGNWKSAYILMDTGINSSIRGDYKTARAKLNQAVKKMHQSISYQKSGNAGTMAALAYFELGKTCQLDGDYLAAKDNFQKCLKIRPGYTPASVRLVDILARYGHLDLARLKAQEAVRNNPKDPRSHLLLALLSQKKGEAEIAKREDRETSRLLSVEAQIIPKNNAKQKNIVRVVDYLNKPKPLDDETKKEDRLKPHDEVSESDAIKDEVKADQDSKKEETPETKPKTKPITNEAEKQSTTVLPKPNTDKAVNTQTKPDKSPQVPLEGDLQPKPSEPSEKSQ